MEKFEIYNNLVNEENRIYGIESIKTQIMLLETELLYSLDSKKMQIVINMKKEYENLLKKLYCIQ